MMREIIFRGKDNYTGEWVFGVPVYNNNRCFIISGAADWDIDFFQPERWNQVDPETVGQFTGLLDKNGKRIFEGDIVIGQNYMFPCYDSRELTVEFSVKDQAYITRLMNKDEIEIIGNIHE